MLRIFVIGNYKNVQITYHLAHENSVLYSISIHLINIMYKIYLP